jgi:hypothetical protein
MTMHITEAIEEFTKQFPVGSIRRRIADECGRVLLELFPDHILVPAPKPATVERVRRCIP